MNETSLYRLKKEGIGRIIAVGWEGFKNGRNFEQNLMFYLSISAFFLSLAAIPPNNDAGLVRSPPKLIEESPQNVWFQIPSTGAPHKFMLKCNASGDPQTERYKWFKNGQEFDIDGESVIWRRPGVSGTIVFLRPTVEDQGEYQCHVHNIFGTAVTNIFHAQLGVLDHFVPQDPVNLNVREGESLTLNCSKPHGIPSPSIFWLFRNTKQSWVIETINRRHITVDDSGNLHFSFVEEHDGRANLVYQCAATSPVLHGEYRALNEYTLNITKARMFYREPKKLWFSPSETTVTAGEKLRLTCIFSGSPLPEIRWWREGGELSNGRVKRENFGKTLILEPVISDDEGVYVCRAGNKQHRMKVLVTAAPHWRSSPPSDKSPAEHSNTALRCDVEGNPTPTIRWYMNGIPLSNVSENKRRRVLENGRVLRIANLDHDVDTAVYQCNASNHLGYTFTNAYINVQAFAPKFLSSTNQTIKVVKGSNVDLDCNVTAAPSPKTKWVDANDIPINRKRENGHKFEFLKNRALRLKSVSLSDSGLYYCNVSNKYGINRGRRKLEVYEPTYFIKGLEPKIKRAEAFDEVEVTCTVKADDRLEVNYFWMKDGQLIDFEEEPDHFQLIKGNHLRITVRGRHSGIYTCLVKTAVDKLRSEMELIVKDIPEPPEVTEIECNERRALIRWKPSHPNSDPVFQYIVQYATAFHPDQWKVALTEEKMSQAVFEGIHILSPWVDYTFRVLAVNSRGESKSGYREGTECATSSSFPYSNPINVSASGDANDNLVIYWNPMEKEDWNGEEFRYRIRYRLDEPGGEWKEFDVEDPQASKTTIRDQPTFRRYLVQVVAVNKVGISIIEPKNVVGFSGEDVPREAPEDFKILEKINATAVEFSWKHVNPDSVRGHFRGYKIKIEFIGSGIDGLNLDANVGDRVIVVGPEKDERTLVVNGLKPMHKYSAVIHALNTRYKGPPSIPAIFDMPEGLPSEVSDLEVESVGAHTILVTWNPPLIILGRLSGYFLTFTNINTNTTEETYVLAHKRYYLYENAASDSKYSITVWGETGGGEGPTNTALTVTWPNIPPGKPNMLVETMGGGRARIEWIPSQTSLPGSAFYLNYSLEDDREWTQTDFVRVPGKKYTLSNLIPNAAYLVHAVSNDGTLSTPSVQHRFHTKDPRGLTDNTIITDTFTSAAWFIAAIGAIIVAVIFCLIICVIQRNKGGKYPVKKKELERGHGMEKEEEERNFMEYQFGGDYSKDPT